MAEEFTVSIAFKGKDEMSRPAAQMNQALAGMARNQQQVTRFSSEMGNALKGVFVGIGLNTVKSFAEDFNALGTQIQQADRMFANFGGNADVLADLRRETRGAVDDFTLMRGAADLMNLGITRSMGDASRLIGMIEAVKKPTEDTAQALENFSLLIANQSFLRLDTFGINSAMVRDRVQELKDTLDMSSEAAFTQATMEALEQKVVSLGDAAFASDTALNRMGVTLKNVTNDAAREFADVLERGVTALEQLGYIAATGNFGALFGQDVFNPQAATEEATIRTAYEEYGRIAADAFLSGYEGGVDPEIVRQFTAALSDAVRQSVAEGNGGMLWDAQLNELMRDAQMLPTLGTPVTDNVLLQVTDEYYKQWNYLREAAEINAQNLRIEQEEAAMLRARNNLIQIGVQARQNMLASAEREAQLNSRLDPLYETYSQLYTLMHETEQMRGGMFFTAEEAATADRLVEQFDYLYSQLEAAGDQEIISDAELDRLKEMGGTAREWANEIERGAREVEGMTLSELLRESSGGVLGELTDRLAAQMTEAGLTQEAIDAFLSEANLASGRETALSQGLNPFLDSLVNLPPESQITAMQNLVDSLREYQLQGGDPNLVTDNMLAQMANVTNGKVGFLGFDAGQTISDMLNLQEERQNIDDMKGALSDALNEGNLFKEVIDDASRVLDEIDGRKVEVQLNVVAPEWFSALMASGGSGGMAGAMDHVVRSNGGRVPGADPRGRQITR